MKKLLNISTLKSSAVPALLVALLAAAPAQARQLSVEEALQAAVANNSGAMRLKSAKNFNLAYTAKQGSLNTVYVFNRGENDGFMLVAADDVADAVLGYSDNGAFDAANMPENLKGWLENYSAQIAYAAANGTRVISAPARASYADIAPIVKTLWDQGYPYNNDCPTDDNGIKCYTGCVATAMSQVMKAYNWPEKGVGENSYYCNTIEKALSFNYGETTFDWANMISVYPGTEAQNAAVATLMVAAGISVDMGYGISASGAFSQNVPSAFIDHFNYDKSAHFSYRRFYPLPTWMEMIYDELSQGHPLYYSGQAADGSGGHAFVIDGYRSSDGFVHVNWGWSGMSDGYYLITTLDPAMQGAGGAGAGFSDSQGAIFSLKKPVEGSKVYPNLTVDANFGTKSSAYFKSQSDYVTFNGTISCSALADISYRLGVRLLSEAGGEPTYLWNPGLTTTAPNGQVGAFPVRYADFPSTGKYTVTPVYMYDGVIYDMPIAVGKVHSLTLEASDKELVFTPIVEVPNLSASDIEVLTPVYAGKYARFTAVVKNSGAEYFGKVQLAFTGKGSTTQIYSSIAGPAIDLTEGESETIEFYGTVPTNILTPDTYLVVATEDGQFISDKVQIKLNPRPAEEAVVEYVSSQLLDTYGGRGTTRRPYIVTGNPLRVEATFKCTAGTYFADYIIYWIGNTNAQTYSGYPSEDITCLEGEEVTFTMNVSDYSLVEGNTYRGVFGYVVTNDRGSYLEPYEGAPTTYFKIDASAGVSDVTADAENVSIYPNPAESECVVSADAAITSVEFYSMTGSMALNVALNGQETIETLDVTSLAPGVYVVKINTLAGSVTERLIKK